MPKEPKPKAQEAPPQARPSDPPKKKKKETEPKNTANLDMQRILAEQAPKEKSKLTKPKKKKAKEEEKP